MRLVVKKILWFVPSIVFLAGIFVPFFMNIRINPALTDQYENRVLAPLPKIISTQFPKNFEMFYQDHLPGRQKILDVYHKTRMRLFSSHEKVIFGKDGWIFYKSHPDGNSISDFFGDNLLRGSDRDEFVRRSECVMGWVKKSGVKSVVVMIPPNKEQIYSEKMPPLYEALKEDADGRREQIEALLASKGYVVVPIKKLLIDGKRERDTYYWSDTHWNSFGGFLGFQGFASAINQAGPSVISPNSLVTSWKEVERKCGDIFTNMLGFRDPCVEYDYLPEFGAVKMATDARCDSVGPGHTLCHNSTALNNKKIVVVGDSFRIALMPYFLRFFKEVIFFHRVEAREVIQKAVESDPPDTILFESVERHAPFVLDLKVCEGKKYL